MPGKPKRIRTTSNTPSYPYIRAFEKYMGARQYYIDDRIQRAIDTNAPSDAYNEEYEVDSRTGESIPSGKWKVIGDMGNSMLRDALIREVEQKGS